MKNIFLLLALAISIAGTGCKKNDDLHPSNKYTQEQINRWSNQLVPLRDSIKSWSTTCSSLPDGGHPYTNEISERRNGDCYQWDSNEYAGMGCLAAVLAGDN